MIWCFFWRETWATSTCVHYIVRCATQNNSLDSLVYLHIELVALISSMLLCPAMVLKVNKISLRIKVKEKPGQQTGIERANIKAASFSGEFCNGIDVHIFLHHAPFTALLEVSWGTITVPLFISNSTPTSSFFFLEMSYFFYHLIFLATFKISSIFLQN